MLGKIFIVHLRVRHVEMYKLSTGVFNWSEFHDSNKFFGPLFFVSFMLIINFILINMFLSIVNDAFAVVKHEHIHLSNDYELMDFMWYKLKSCFCGSSAVDPHLGEYGLYAEGKTSCYIDAYL